MSCLNSCGVPKALGVYNRRPKQETFGLIPDDGFVSLLKLTHPIEGTQDDQLGVASRAKGPPPAVQASVANDQ